MTDKVDKNKTREIYEIYLNKAMSLSNIDEAIENMKLALMHAKAKVPPQVINSHKLKGTLYSEPKARDYLMIKGQLGYLYEINGDYDNAISIYQKLLELDRNDNQNVRDKLISIFILKKRYDQAYKLIKVYEKDESAAMLYNKSLYYFVKKDKFNSKLFIRKAMKENKYIPEYLIGIKSLNFEAKNPFEPGSEDEAKFYLDDAMIAWTNNKDAMLWVVDEYFLYADKTKINIEWDKRYIKNIIEKIYDSIE